MFKSLLFALGLVFVGAIVGIAHSAYDLGYFGVGAQDPEGVALAPISGPQPRVELESERFDFGRMERGKKGEYKFVFRNTGAGVLVLRAGDPPCKCTTPLVENGVLQPGESTNVIIGWTTDQSAGPFRKTIPIHTSDRRRPLVQLELQGNIVQSYEAQTQTFELGKMLYQQPRSAQVRLFGFGEAPLEIKKWELIDPASAEFFEVQIEPLNKEQTGRSDATSGLLVRLKTKPGLPEGGVRQGLRVWLNASEEPLDLSVYGEVKSDIVVEGSGWDSASRRLNFGLVSAKEGAHKKLEIRLHGQHDVSKFRVTKVDPPEMQATLGAPEKVGGTKGIRLPLEVSIPAGARPLNRMGTAQGELGEIVIETDRADGQPLTIYVRFATASE
jgi:hypothetical protein